MENCLHGRDPQEECADCAAGIIARVTLQDPVTGFEIPIEFVRYFNSGISLRLPAPDDSPRFELAEVLVRITGNQLVANIFTEKDGDLPSQKIVLVENVITKLMED